MAALGVAFAGGALSIAFADRPCYEVALDSTYAGADDFFVTLETMRDGLGASLVIILHPKVDGLRLDAVSAVWPGFRTPSRPQGQREYRTVALDLEAGATVSLRSLDESTAFSHFSASAEGLQLHRPYGGRALRHSLTILHLRLGPLAGSAVSASNGAPAPSAVLRLPPSAGTWRGSEWAELLGASFLPELGVDTAWLDLRLTLDFRGQSEALYVQIAAFAKTCHSLGLRPGISFVPFGWSAAGGSRGFPSEQSKSPSPGYVDSKGTWTELIGQEVFPIREWTQKAETSMVQTMLSLRDLGYTYFDLDGLSLVGDPLRPIYVPGEADRLHRGIALLADASAGTTVVAHDLPVEYLSDVNWFHRPILGSNGTDSREGFWRKPLLPFLKPRFVPALDNPLNPMLVLSSESLRIDSSKRAPAPPIYSVPALTRREREFLRKVSPELPQSYWRRLESQVHLQAGELQPDVESHF